MRSLPRRAPYWACRPPEPEAMAPLTLKFLLSQRSGNLPAIMALREVMGAGISIVDPSGKLLLGESFNGRSSADSSVPVQYEESTLGYVTGPAAAASALALLLGQLACRETEGRALGAEVLHLYREVNLIEQLSEQLAALLNSS